MTGCSTLFSHDDSGIGAFVAARSWTQRTCRCTTSRKSSSGRSCFAGATAWWPWGRLQRAETLVNALEIPADHDAEWAKCGGWATGDPEAGEGEPRTWCPKCRVRPR